MAYSVEDIISILETNSDDVFKEATRLLIKIADNIIDNPTKLNVRKLMKSNGLISKNVLGALGGLECLRLMGFKDDKTSFILPADQQLHSMLNMRKALIESRKLPTVPVAQDSSKNVSKSAKPVKEIPQETSQSAVKRGKYLVYKKKVPKIDVPPYTPTLRTSNSFLERMERYFHASLKFEDKALQEYALKIIPLHRLEIAAQKRLHHVQERAKKDKTSDPEVSVQDMLILELLEWFKKDFFTWIDSPDCYACGEKTKFSHNEPGDELTRQYASRVEVHKCQNRQCKYLNLFPRYDNLYVLLNTRSGRCGEWANTFTLLCRALKWDARFVVEEGDHVWTEVYSFAQKRWLHCDPCENICDASLIYENGWCKAISYVMAYSAEEIQDVTWRYTSHHKEALKRRKSVQEADLLDAINELKTNRQKSLTDSRRQYLAKRLLKEIVELMVEKTPNDFEVLGRVSGSAAWKLSRGETHENAAHIWKIKESEPVVQYSIAADRYEILSKDGSIKNTLKGWRQGTFECDSLFRKEEEDWKMAYLARTEGSSDGSISWKFACDAGKVVDKIDMLFEHTLFDSGKADVVICGESQCVQFPKEKSRFITDGLSGSSEITIKVNLTGGSGNMAWQQVQLFREFIDSKHHSFKIGFTLKNK